MVILGVKANGLASIWAPASQDSGRAGNASVGGVSMRGAPVAMPTSATVQFQRFFDCGRAIRCLLSLGGSRFMHWVVLYGYQGADTDAEQLALTEQLFDAAAALSCSWRFRRGAHQDPLPETRDRGWPLG